MNAAASREDKFRNCLPDDGDPQRAPDNIDRAPVEPHRCVHALLRKQAACLIDWTLHAEVETLLAQHASIRDADGRPAYVRNGYQPTRNLVTNLGPVRIRIPKVRSRVDPPVVLRSALAPPYLRRTRSTMREAPAHFLRGIGLGDLQAAIRALMGPEAAALPGPVLRRLIERWEAEHQRWLTGSLSRLEGISLWLDSIDGGDPPHGVGTVMLAVAVDASAQEHIVSIVHGSSSSEQGWVQLLRGLRSRGMPPPLALHLGSSENSARRAAAMVYPQIAARDHAEPRAIRRRYVSGFQ